MAGVALFPNLLQAMIPASIPALNRSHIFARVMEDAWDSIYSTRAFARTIAGAWNPEGSGGALIVNMTDADRGHQVVAAPFRVRSSRRQDLYAFRTVEETINNLASETPAVLNRDIKISSAIALSASFPVVIGGGNLRNEVTGDTLRISDGGVYENSGTSSLLQLIDQLRDFEEREDQPIEIHVIILDHQWELDGNKAFYHMIVPLRALLTTRSMRARISIADLYKDRSLSRVPPDSQAPIHLDTEKAGSNDCRSGDKNAYGNLEPIHIPLNLDSLPIPVAFQLSPNANSAVDLFRGRLNSCSSGNGHAGLENSKLRNLASKIRCNEEALCRATHYLDR